MMMSTDKNVCSCFYVLNMSASTFLASGGATGEINGGRQIERIKKGEQTTQEPKQIKEQRQKNI